MTAPVLPLKFMDTFDLRTELVRNLHDCVENGMAVADATRVETASRLAAFAHRGQLRKWRDGNEHTPYIEHPLRVALRLMRWGAHDADLLCAALLHDVVEDSAELVATTLAARNLVEHTERETSHPQIHAALSVIGTYGPNVADIVLEVTNLPDGSETYLEKIQRITNNRDAVLVKLSDMVDNAGSLIHQRGHVSEAFIDRRVVKYTPALAMLVDASRQRGDDLGEICADRGDRLMSILATMAK